MARINLSKVKKCGQIWDDMTPNEKGRVCEQCSKTIIDFRHLSDHEVAQIHMFSNEPVCGLYNKKQLAAPSKETAVQQPLKWASLYLGIGGLFFSSPLSSQETVDSLAVIQIDKDKDTIYIDGKYERPSQVNVVKDTIIITGKVIDHNNEPIIGGTIVIKDTQIGTVTNFDGNYSLNITKALEDSDKAMLQFSYVGYSNVEIEIDKETIIENNVLDIVLSDREMIEAIMFYTERTPLHKRIWNKIKYAFTRKSKR